MSLYSHNFTFLNPPKRYYLSWGNEETRARIPNFQNVTQLQEFVLRLFDYRFDVGRMDVQLKIGVGLECLVLLISSLIVGRRIYEGNFWIFRLIKTSTGSILVPNTMLAFIVTETIFKVTFITMQLELSRYYNRNSNGPPNLALWILLPWCSLIFGAFLAAVGTHYATPKGIREGLNNPENHQSNKLKKFFFHAYTANFIAFAIPIICCISIAIPSFIANGHYMQARDQQIQWNKQYSNSTQFSQEMIIEAQLIWYKALRAMKVASGTFVLWFVWAMVCFVMYTFSSFRLIKAVVTEMRKTNMDEMKFMVTTLHNPMLDFSQDEEDEGDYIHMKHIHFKDNISGEQQELTIEEIDEGKNKRQDNTQDEDDIVFDMVPAGGRISLSGNPTVITNKESDRTLQQSIKEARPSKEGSRSSKIGKSQTTTTKKISNLLVNQRDIAKKVVLKQNQLISIKDQKKELRKAALNILAQVSVISPGCIILGGIAFFLALSVYGGYEQPVFNQGQNGIGTYFERLTGLALILIIYTVALLGLFIFACILFRVYEPALVNIKTSEKSAVGGSNSSGSNQQNQSKHSTKFGEGRKSTLD